MAHTPAPWSISKHATPKSHPQFGVYADESPNDHCIVKGDNAEADALLIAAAPELLEALNTIHAHPNDPYSHRLAMDAINKATA